MATWTYLAQLIAFFTLLSVASAAITAEYTCRPGPTGYDGTFTITLKENNAIDLGNVLYVQNTTGNPDCGTADAGAALVLQTPDPGAKKGTNTLTLNVNITDLPCGLSSSEEGAQLDFVTQSLSNGAYSKEDRRFQITCASFNTSSAAVAATPLPISGALPNIAAGLSLAIEIYDAGATSWNTLASGHSVSFADTIRVKATLDSTANTVKEMQVTKCTFQQVSSTTKSSIILDKTGANVCAKRAGAELGFNLKNKAFTYVTDATTVTATTEGFSTLTFFRTADAGGTLPAMTLTCDVNYCDTGCADASNCNSNTGASRKRRATTQIAQLHAVFLVTSAPPKAMKRQICPAVDKPPVCETPSNIGFVAGLAVLGILLVLAIGVIVVMIIRMKKK